jgi:hypothetical protein
MSEGALRVVSLNLPPDHDFELKWRFLFFTNRAQRCIACPLRSPHKI